MIYTQEQLAEALGYKPTEAARIRQCLEKQGIRVLRGRQGRVWTTTELILDAGKQEPREVDFA